MGWFKTAFTKETGIIMSEAGEEIGKAKIKLTENTFTYGDRQYIVIRDGRAYRFRRKRLFSNNYAYFYDKDNPMPLRYNKIAKIMEPIIDSELFHAIMENEALIKLNQANSKFKLKPIHIMIALGAIALFIWYAQNGGK